MSTNVDLGTENIQHIDDACEEEYNEGFAPKAQEEILSETQDSLKNNTDEIQEKSESEDISNVDINEASSELVKEVITDAEADLNENNVENNIDLSPDCEVNIEAIEPEESDVVMEESEANIVSESEDQQVEDKEIQEDTSENVIIDVPEKEDNEATPNEPEAEDIIEAEAPVEEPDVEETVQIEPEAEENIETEVVIEEAIPAEVEVEEPVAEENVQAEETIKSDDVDEDIQPEPSVAQEVIDTEIKADEAVEDQSVQNEEVEQEHDVPKADFKAEDVKITSTPIKGKDVKSLSSTYGHEENTANGNCCMCEKIVYPMEKLVTNDRIFHKMCFRCTKCKNALSAGNFTFNHGKPYCTPHYVELFKKRGRYDEIDDKMETENSANAEINDVITDELPAPDTTKNILAKFRDLQSGGSNSVNSSINEPSDELPAPNTTKNLMERFTALGQDKSEPKCKPKIDIPRHTNGHSNGTSENVPVALSKDVVRSNDPAQDELPEQGITKNLVNQFRKMESLANN